MVEPISLKTRQKMQAAGDYTVNAVGPSNQMPKSSIKNDATVMLIDGFIRDGWIDPASRMDEIAFTFQAQLLSSQRLEREATQRREADAYRQEWIERWNEWPPTA